MNDAAPTGWNNTPASLPPVTNGMLALPPGSPAHPHDFGGTHHQVNIFKVLHGMFRGRYALTLAMAAALFAVGGAIGWLTSKPLYRSKGLIQVTPVNMDPIKGTVDPMVFADSFVKMQSQIILSERVISKAQSSKAWQSLQVPNTPEEERKFRNALVVKPQRDTIEAIDVSFTHENPLIAFTALIQVCEAYNQLFVEFEDRDRQAHRERILRDAELCRDIF